MGFRLILSGLLFLIPSLAFAQPVSVSSSVAKKLRYTTALPATCVAGEIYADSNATSGQQIYICESANTWVLQGDGGGASGWTDDGTELRLTTSTDEVEIGSAATLSAKFAVNGDTDEIQLLIQGNATQTSDILVIENSAGTDILTGAAGGVKVTGNAQVTQLASCETIATDSNGIMRCDPDGGGGGNTFETIAVPAGTNPVADSSTDTITITETTFLTITGTAATDTIDITQVTTDIGTDGLIAANSVALTTDTTGNYAAGDAEAGAALTGDTATAFFGAGTIEDARLPTSMADKVITGSLALPQGAAPTVDAAGEIAVDTTTDQLQYFGGAKRTLPYSKEICVTLETPVDADDNIMFFQPRHAITITDVVCRIDGGTSIPLTISDGTNALEAITCATTATEDDGSIANGTFTALERMEFDLGTPTGTQTWLNFCVTYTVDAD